MTLFCYFQDRTEMDIEDAESDSDDESWVDVSHSEDEGADQSEEEEKEETLKESKGEDQSDPEKRTSDPSDKAKVPYSPLGSL